MRTIVALSAATLIALSGLALAEPQPGTAQPPAEKKSVPATPLVKPNADPAKKDAPKVEPTLKVGDAAPALKIDSWIKGEEVKSLEKGKVYVVEFWATWCGPCVKMFPHLTKLQKDHPELTVIGVAASERAPKQGEADKRVETLKAFVDKQGANMGYRVAYDSDREMGNDWMKASGQRGIPCAFVVGHDGKLAFIGHPSGMDGAVSKALKAAQDAKKTASAK